MDIWLQEKYILLLSNRFERFKRTGPNLFNMRCPYCGDSQKNKTKARGYIFKVKDTYFYKCHNCNIPKKFETVLKELDPPLYFEAKKESFGSNEVQKVEFEKKTRVAVDGVLLPLSRISDLPSSHMARAYLANRKIPGIFYPNLYYCPDFRAYVNNLIPKKLSSPHHAIPRLVIPFLNKNGDCFGFQGRALDPREEIRYISIILDDTQPKAYGVDRTDFNKRYYVFEGPFDSMFVENGMAACGSDVLSVLNSLAVNRENGVIVFDNEPRNSQIVDNVEKAINCDWSVCIWPSWWEYKDVNDAILDGYTPSEVNAVIDAHTYKGLTAKLNLVSWRKI